MDNHKPSTTGAFLFPREQVLRRGKLRYLFVLSLLLFLGSPLAIAQGEFVPGCSADDLTAAAVHAVRLF